VEIDAREFAAEAKHGLAFNPTDGVDEIVVILVLGLISEGRGSQLKTRAGEHKLVDRIGYAVGGPIDSHIGDGDGGHVVQLIVDVYQAKTEFIDKRGREQVTLSNIQEARVHRG